MEVLPLVLTVAAFITVEAAIDKRCFHHSGSDTFTCLEFIDHVTVTWEDGARMCESRGYELMTHEIRERLDYQLQSIVKADECEFWVNGTQLTSAGCAYMRCPDYQLQHDLECEGHRPVVCQQVTVDYYKNIRHQEYMTHKAKVIGLAVVLSVFTVAVMMYVAKKWMERILNRNRVAPLNYYVPPQNYK